MKMFDFGLCILAVLFSVAFTYFMTHKTCHECYECIDGCSTQQGVLRITVLKDD